MFGMGWTEIAMIALVTLIFVGPKHLPEMMQKVGKIIGELRSASRELRNQIAVEAAEIKRETGVTKSPGAMIKEAGQDLMSDLPSPYDEVVKAEKAANELNNSIVGDVTDGQPPTEIVEKTVAKTDTKTETEPGSAVDNDKKTDEESSS